MTINSKQALFETTKRLLSSVINEGLVTATLSKTPSKPSILRLSKIQTPSPSPAHPLEKWLQVGLASESESNLYTNPSGNLVSLLRPEWLVPPVVIAHNGEEKEAEGPDVLFRFLCGELFVVAPAGEIVDQMAVNLINSAANQEKWLEIYDGEKEKELGFESMAVDWERVLTTGYPTHPFNRLCHALPPLEPVGPEDLPEMRNPTLIFISIPRTDLRIFGPFEEKLQPFLNQLEIPPPPPESQRIIVPALKLQMPAIYHYFPNATVVKSVADCVDTQASMRTLTPRPGLNYPHHIKLSLTCQITSDIRAIRPCQTLGGQLVREHLAHLMPEDLWLFSEVAAVSGAQRDEDAARHIGVVLREDIEPKAKAKGESLIMAGALAERAPGSGTTRAEVLFSLETREEKRRWLERYVRTLFGLLFPLLIKYGIGFETHGQNTFLRVDCESKQIKGFAIRDHEGVKIHLPTLREQGIDLDIEASPGCTNDLLEVLSKVHHALVQNHIGNLLYNMNIDASEGWAIVRGAFDGVVKGDQSRDGRRVLEFMMGDMMLFKCFLGQRMSGAFNDYQEGDDPNNTFQRERPIPNILLTGCDRWEDILAHAATLSK